MASPRQSSDVPTPRPFHAALGGAQLSKVAAALAESPRFLILDFRRALGCTLFAARPGRFAQHVACVLTQALPSNATQLPQAGAGPGRHRRPLLCHPAQQAAPHGHTGGKGFAWTAAYHKGGARQSVCSAGRCTTLLSACSRLWRAALPVRLPRLEAVPHNLFSQQPLLPAHHLLQLIITHIPARRGNVRRLLAAQGLILVQPTAVNDLQDDSCGCWLEGVVGGWPESQPPGVHQGWRHLHGAFHSTPCPSSARPLCKSNRPLVGSTASATHTPAPTVTPNPLPFLCHPPLPAPTPRPRVRLVPHNGCRLPVLRGALPGSGGGTWPVPPARPRHDPGTGGAGGGVEEGSILALPT